MPNGDMPNRQKPEAREALAGLIKGVLRAHALGFLDEREQIAEEVLRLVFDDVGFGYAALLVGDRSARLLAPYKQPEVAELLRRAAEYEGGCAEVVENAEALATDLCRWAAALAALAEAQAKLARVEGLPAELYRDGHCMHDVGKCNCGWGMGDAAKRLEAALSGAGGVLSAETAKGSLGA